MNAETKRRIEHIRQIVAANQLARQEYRRLMSRVEEVRKMARQTVAVSRAQTWALYMEEIEEATPPTSVDEPPLGAMLRDLISSISTRK